MKRTLALLTAVALLAACSTVRKLEVDPTLEEPLPEGAPVGRPVRVAIYRQEPPPQSPNGGARGAAGDTPAVTSSGKPGAKPPPLPETRVDFSNTYAEEYPSVQHMLKSVPLALREVGFDVVEVKNLQEARAARAAMILELLPPEIEGFRQASGRNMTAGGSSYDIHVLYRGRLSSSAGPMGLVSGHGESSTHFIFADPYVETASVGAVSLSLMAVVSVVVAIPLIGFMVYRASQGAGDPLGYCTPENVPGEIKQGSFETSRAALCGKVAWLAAETAVAGAIISVAGITLGVAEFVGHRVFGGGRGFVRSLATERTWRGMVKAAHDRAARALATSMVEASGRLPPDAIPANTPKVYKLPPGGGGDGAP
ncbi:MAG: hypothetical protein AB2A00_05840 [Myxococcota bacterium]